MKTDLVQVIIQQYLLSEEMGRILTAIAVALIAYLIFSRFSRHWLNTLFRQLTERGKISKLREKQVNNWIIFFEQTGGVLILVILALTILADFGYNIAPILTGAGILGLVVGLGSQNILKDVLSGVFIFLEGHYSEGEYVKIAGLSGKVVKMTLRRTILRSEKDGTLHIIPNSEVKTISLISQEGRAKITPGLPKKKSVIKG